MRRRSGFTLIELLVVIGIILVLIAILLPVVSSVRLAASNTASQSQMSRIMAACQNYYHDWNAYPGPVHNVNLAGEPAAGANGVYVIPTTPQVTITINGVQGTITSSENLVLGLFGMITPPNPTTTTATSITMTYVPPATTPPHDVLSLNVHKPGSYHYMDYVADELTPLDGRTQSMEFATGASPAPSDSNVPEFVDRFTDHLPILYIRSNRGNPNGADDRNKSEGTANGGDSVQYNIDQLGMYGCSVPQTDGSGKWQLFTSANETAMYANSQQATPTLADNVATPYNDFWSQSPAQGTNYYFMNPNITLQTRGKDGFVLISAGKDRVYGTLDDIIVTP